jgi:hypothetical protein
MIHLLLSSKHAATSVYSLLERFLDSCLDTMLDSVKEQCVHIVGGAHAKCEQVKKEWEHLVQRHTDQVRLRDDVLDHKLLEAVSPPQGWQAQAMFHAGMYHSPFQMRLFRPPVPVLS